MFKLYYMPDARLLAEENNEILIKEKLGNYLGCLEIISYMITETDEKDNFIQSTLIQDYDDYLEYKYNKPKTLTKHL